MPIPFRLEHVIEKVLAGASGSPRRTLKRLAGVRLSTSEALDAWPRVLEHKWYLSERVGRDVGLRVAAVDFFENIERPRARVSLRTRRDTLPPRLPMMLPFGERKSSWS